MSEPPDNANNSLLSSLSVEEAATALRVSGQTIRRRLKRGELRGEKIIGPTGSEWRVYRDGPLTPVEQPSTAVVGGEVVTLPASYVRALDNTLQQLTTEVARLREEVVALRAQQAQQALPAPRRPWWRVWRRR